MPSFEAFLNWLKCDSKLNEFEDRQRSSNSKGSLWWCARKTGTIEVKLTWHFEKKTFWEFLVVLSHCRCIWKASSMPPGLIKDLQVQHLPQVSEERNKLLLWHSNISFSLSLSPPFFSCPVFKPLSPSLGVMSESQISKPWQSTFTDWAWRRKGRDPFTPHFLCHRKCIP